MSSQYDKERERQKKLGNARRKACASFPYIQTVYRQLVAVEDNEIEAMAVTTAGTLYYNGPWFDAQEQWVLDTGFAHEGLHVYLAHGERGVGMDWNIACDYALHGMLSQAGYVFPKWALDPKDARLPADLTADQYYELVKRKKPEPNAGEREAPGPGTGQCGGGAGNPQPGEKAPDDEAEENKRAASEIEAARRAGDKSLATAQAGGKYAGKVSAALVREVAVVRGCHNPTWRQVLRRVVSETLNQREGADDYSYESIPMERAHGVILPALVSTTPRIAVAIDTSGSMRDLIDAVLGECEEIARLAEAKMDLIVFDAKVLEAKSVRDVAAMRAALRGCGGTDFRVVFDHVAEMPSKPDVVIVLTDGQGPAPQTETVPTIWGIVGTGNSKPSTWGIEIKCAAG